MREKAIILVLLQNWHRQNNPNPLLKTKFLSAYGLGDTLGPQGGWSNEHPLLLSSDGLKCAGKRCFTCLIPELATAEYSKSAIFIIFASKYFQHRTGGYFKGPPGAPKTVSLMSTPSDSLQTDYVKKEHSFLHNLNPPGLRQSLIT